MRGADKPAAVVLAAGCSSRAPGFKPLLPLGGSTVIENTIGSLRRAGVDDITVVAGHRAAELLPVLDRIAVRAVVNDRYRDGMFSSVVAGVKSLPADAGAFFILPADIPLVKSHTIRRLARAARKGGNDVVYPVFQGRRGHPPLIAASLLPAIMAWDGTEGLRGLLARCEPRAGEVAVADEGIMMDIDTADDYRRILDHHACRHFPTGSECEAIMAMLAVPENVARHSRMVAGVAGTIAGRLALAGHFLDAGLAAAAGRLHDLAKGRPDHPRHGARIVKSLGYPRVAAVVAVHHDFLFAEGQELDEAAIVYLADKLVQNERLVTIEERVNAARERFAADAAAQRAADERLATAQRIAARVEAAVGASLREVICGATGWQAAGEGG